MANRPRLSLPRYIVSDKGRQFWCRSLKTWCKRRDIRPPYGRVGEPASIAIVERFIRSMKGECTRCLLVPMSLASMRRELHLYTIWYKTERSHMGFAGKTPHEVWSGRDRSGDRFTLDVSYVEGRKHLPVIELRRAA